MTEIMSPLSILVPVLWLHDSRGYASVTSWRLFVFINKFIFPIDLSDGLVDSTK